MKISFLLFVIFLTQVASLQNYLGTDVQKCINCLCHARTGCFSRINCASYSISFEYWKTARSPVLSTDDDPDSEESYKKCIKNENCILATIVQYADAIGHKDCNCDGTFDCKDRMAIHLFGNDCENPKFTKTRAVRYNSCVEGMGYSTMNEEEGYDGCAPEVFPQ